MSPIRYTLQQIFFFFQNTQLFCTLKSKTTNSSNAMQPNWLKTILKEEYKHGVTKALSS